MNIFLEAIIWQFVDVPRNIIQAWRNYLFFNLKYFSISFLLRTFFSPWHRYRYSYGKIFELKKNFGTFIFNSMSRIIGALLRLFLIFFAIFIEIVIFFIGLIIFFGWLLLPALLVLGLIFGFILLI